ncbi:hypothetical protein ACF1HJ_25555 [Streptomyces sp. NPDC013978]|uniref:hypothetical protein n=1 Tax=Streptomyces sp. NPDC013978 TaxID=3364869 RepID=UPI0036F9869B
MSGAGGVSGAVRLGVPAPGRTRFLFDRLGYPSAQVDKNGNRMEFTYEERLFGHPSKLLKYVTDAEGRRTLTVDHWERSAGGHRSGCVPLDPKDDHAYETAGGFGGTHSPSTCRGDG